MHHGRHRRDAAVFVDDQGIFPVNEMRLSVESLVAEGSLYLIRKYAVLINVWFGDNLSINCIILSYCTLY